MGKKKKNIFSRLITFIGYLIFAFIGFIIFIMYSNSTESKTLSSLDIVVIFGIIIIFVMSASIQKLENKIEDLENRVSDLEHGEDDYSPHGYLYNKDMNSTSE